MLHIPNPTTKQAKNNIQVINDNTTIDTSHQSADNIVFKLYVFWNNLSLSNRNGMICQTKRENMSHLDTQHTVLVYRYNHISSFTTCVSTMPYDMLCDFVLVQCICIFVIWLLNWFSAVSHPIYFKASFSVHKLIPQNTQMTTLFTNLSLYITFTMIYYIRQEPFVKVYHHYLTSGGYQVCL